jgi:hypothetical protein
MKNKLEISGNTIIGIENGSNTNGSYTKFSDGTIIQYGMVEGDAITAGGRMVKLVSLPYSFVDAEYTVTVTQYGGYTFSGGTYANLAVLNSNQNAFTIFFTQAIAFTPKFSWIAIGRWK